MGTRVASIAVDGLRARYGRTEVLCGLDLAIAAGRSVALLGPSGCGKTTLLRALAGFVPASAGTIRVDAVDMTHAPANRRGMAMVFQSYALWPHMTVAQNIGYGLKLRNVSAAARTRKVDRVLEMLRLTGLGDRPATALSGGQRQRVALGRALAVDPRVLLLDEPLSNLDARVRFEVRHELRALQQELGVTSVCVTHDKEDAMVLGDDIAVVVEGRIGQIGPPSDVYEQPADPWIADFLGATNRIALTLTADAEAPLIGPSLVAAPGADWQTAVRARDPAPGHRVLCFRPGEVIETTGDGGGPPAPDHGPVIAGTVVDSVYVGGAYRSRIRLESGVILADLPQSRPADATVRLRLQVPGGRLFPAAES